VHLRHLSAFECILEHLRHFIIPSFHSSIRYYQTEIQFLFVVLNYEFSKVIKVQLAPTTSMAPNNNSAGLATLNTTKVIYPRTKKYLP